VFSASIAARVLLLAAAAGAVIVLVITQRNTDSCEQAGKRIFAWASGDAPRSVVRPSIRTLNQSCSGTRTTLAAAVALGHGGLPAPGLRLARDAVREEPKNSYAWATLSVLLRPSDPVASASALQRARKLNPRLGRRRVKPQRQPSALGEQHDSGGVGGP
jgi:hypothetical protein